MDSLPPYFNTGTFNTSAFYTEKDYLTKEEADKLYLSISTSSNFTALSGVTPGTVTASKAVIVDSNKDITGFRNLTSSTLYTTNSLSFSASNSLSSSTCNLNIDSVSGDQTLGSTTSNKFHLRSNGSRKLTINSSGLIGINNTAPTKQLDIIGDTAVSNSLMQISDGIVQFQTYFDGVQCCLQTGTNNRLSFAVNNGSVAAYVETDSSFNVNNTLYCNNTIQLNDSTPIALTTSTTGNSYPMHIHAVTASTGLLNGIAFNTSSTDTVPLASIILDKPSNSNGNLIFYTRQGGATISEVMRLNNSGNVVVANTLSTTTLSTTNFTLNSISVTATGTQLNYLSGTTLGTITASKAVTVDSSSNINSILNLTKTADSRQILFTNGTSTGTVFHSNNGTLFMGTISANDFSLQTNNTVRVNITSAGVTNIISGFQLAGSTVNSTATELNYLSGVTTGTASASKALVLDSNKNIIGINKLNITNANSTALTGTTTADQYSLSLLSTVSGIGQYPGCSIAFRNAADNTGMPFSVILSERTGTGSGDLVFLNLGAANVSECLRVASTGACAVNQSLIAQLSVGGSSYYTDGSYQKLLNLQSNNFDAVEFEIQVNSGANTTSTNAVFMGTLTNNDLRIGANNSTKMIIKANGYVGINTTSPSTYLSVSGTVSNTFNVGGQLYAIGSSTAYTTSQLGPVTVSVSATFAGPIQCSSIYCTSDRRVKKNINLLDNNYCENLYNANVYTFDYIGSDDTIPKIGFIAQDLNKLGYINLLNLNENQNLKFEEEGDIEGIQMSIDYNKVSVINFMMIKKLMNKNKELEERLNKLEKFISKLDIQ
ncbi:MAG: tail fiber domain-containing protein [Caulobacteraceae bacterium]|uniref:Peptidase S74 domain-containing protein n=1 Tax=viral metagenome TaxID=1070528 RepID=A0A6C0H0X9_9ZZZZ|nr:tail fiber domain-containing protein [Caulobacteraceae bacterium]